MATIIDSLLVTLGLDSKGFEAGKKKVDKGLKDTGDEAEKTGKKLKKSGKDGADGFEAAAKGAAKFLAVIGGAIAIKQFIQHQIEANAALDRLSKNLNESVDTVSAWSNAAELAGGSAAGLQGDMDKLSQAQTELQLTGQSSLIPYFSALGMSLADTQGKARPVSDLLLELSDRFSKMDRTTANNMGRMMGLDPGTIQLLIKGRAEVELMIKRQKEFGAVSKQQAEEASRLKRALTEGKQNFEALGRSLLSFVTPAIEKTLQVLGDVFAWMREHKDFVIAFFTLLAAAITAYYLPAMIRAAIATWATIAPMLAIVAPIVAVAAALAALWEDYQVWKAGGDSLIDWSKWEPGINAAKAGIAAFGKYAGDIFYRIFAAADAAASAIKGDWAHAKWAANEALNGNLGASSPAKPAAAPAPAVSPSAPTTSPGVPTSRNAPRGIRNNNPGNLNFAGQAGATKEGGPNGRFAVFGNMQEGVAALVRQIGLYVKRGRNTIRKILEVYAPAFENNTGAYINAVAKALGIGADDPLDTDNASQVMGLVRAIANHENGKGHVSDADIAGGYQLAKGGGIRGASQAAAGAGAGRVAASNAAASPVAGNRSVETNIGEVKVYTQATDAKGIASDMGKSLDYLFTAQANYGLS